MFRDRSSLLIDNSPRMHYGIAVTDVDGDGVFEWVASGFGCPNRVFKWSGGAFRDIASPIIADADRQTISVAAADLDGDGAEEIYLLNTDTFGGTKQFPDRLLDRVDGEWVDLFGFPVNRSVLNLTAGRSVISLDRHGNGLYGFFVANYGGPMRLYELDEDGHCSMPLLKRD